MSRRPPSPPLRKSLGQHHLVDGALTRPLVAFLEPAGRRVVEIGPGGGVLTRELLAAGASVLAWELDPAWAAAAAGALPGERLQVVVGDALDIPFERLPPGTLAAGNLPYNVATPIVARLLTRAEGVPRAAFLVQLEVAERLVAGAGAAAYGALSVLVACHAKAVLLGRVKPGSFRPPPKVDSAFVGLVRHEPPLPPAEMPAFLDLVRRGFGQRRKTLANALTAGGGRGKPAVAATLAAAGIPPRARAEELDLAAWLALYRAWRIP